MGTTAAGIGSTHNTHNIYAAPLPSRPLCPLALLAPLLQPRWTWRARWRSPTCSPATRPPRCHRASSASLTPQVRLVCQAGLAGSGQAPAPRTAGCGNGVNTCCSPLGLPRLSSVQNVRPHITLACLRCPRPPRRRAGAVAARVGCRAAGAAWRRAAGRSGGRLAAHAACDQLGPGGASAEWRSADAGPAAAADRWGGRAGGRAGVGCRRRRGCCCFIATLPPLWR